MDAALGPPDKMDAHSDELTPMMSQYFELCREYDECLVLFQVGDFYETFCEAAEITSRLLEIALTKREDNTGEYPMSGIPIDNAESYIETLLDAGYRVAVADQVEDPEETTGVVERAVTRIVTPGTLTEDELLQTDDNNYVACLTDGRESATATNGGSTHMGEYGLAMLDVSTGDFFATSVDSRPALRDEIGRFAPAEAIVEPDIEGSEGLFDADCMVTAYDEAAFDADDARERVASYFGPPERLLATDAEIRACGALLAYAEYTRGGQDGRLDYLNHLTRYDPRAYMLLDAIALRSLELFEPRAVHGDRETTLVGILDETACALGSRELKDWLRRPLLDRDRIEARLDAVEEWTARLRARERVHDLLRDVYDIERLIGRISRGRANARDLRSLTRTLDVIPDLRDAMVDVESPKLLELRSNLDELAEIRDLIDRAISEEPPAEITEGGIIKPGYNEELDDLRETERAGKEWIDSLEEQERERTAIDSLKVGYNSVHGYYIEVTKPNLDRVPDDYTRRQTLKNAERFYTPELKQREDEIIRTEQRADTLEHQLFTDVRSEVAGESERIQALADALSELDVLVALADVAAKHDYVRPEIGGDGIEVRDGRHPVVERTQESFVPNDTRLDSDAFFAVITGPNMSGKSTYMRQVALITILAQMGSFVPAAAASIGITDRVFTRVGASDDIAGGKSTFMVEMTELAEILGGATERSLVLLDEVGRGTSTTDGLAIAHAITEFIHDEIGAKTLFATHHHELTEVADDLDGVVNLHFDARQEDGEVVFDHDLSPGTATASYGIDVARAAGVPDRVVCRSRALIEDDRAAAGQNEDEATGDGAHADSGDEAVTASDDGALDPPTRDGNGSGTDASVDSPSSHAQTVAAELRETNIAETTPLEALCLLNRLKRRVESNANDDE